MAEKACVKRLQKEFRDLCKELVSHVVARPLPNDILEWRSVTTTVVEKQRLAKASLAFNCKNPTFKKVFPEYLDKYEEQLAAKQPKLEQDTSAPTQEGLLNPLLEKQGAKAELKKIEAPKELNNRRKQSFPVWWLLLLLVSIFGVVMALPLLQV